VNSAEAKNILIACRPGTDDVRTEEALAALEQARRDPELQRWWEQQQAFQQRTRESFRGLPAPGYLREQILAQAKIVAPSWWRRPAAWKAAAAIALLSVVVAVWQKPSPEDSFQTFRSRMVRNVLRQYRMDIKTNDMAQIRQFLASQKAHADYALPEKLGRLPALGGGVLSWQDRRVSMVCLDSGAQGTLFVFVVDTSVVRKAPAQRKYAGVSELMTVSWSEGGKTYVLAGQGGKEALQRFF
jgi:hypothetical protein